MDNDIEKFQSWLRCPYLQFYVSKDGHLFMVDALAVSISRIIDKMLQSDIILDCKSKATRDDKGLDGNS